MAEKKKRTPWEGKGNSRKPTRRVPRQQPKGVLLQMDLDRRMRSTMTNVKGDRPSDPE